MQVVKRVSLAPCSMSTHVTDTLHTVLTDDHHQIPRSTSVIIRRIAPNPRAKNGAGTAARYIAGTSASVGGKDDIVDKRVEQSSRDELINKRTGFGMGPRGTARGNMTLRLDKQDGEQVGVLGFICA